MKSPKKLKAGALQFVLFIGAVIAILLMSFILLSYTHSLFDKKTDHVIQTIKSVDFALKKSLHSRIDIGNVIQFPNENGANITLTVSRDFWGVFEKRTATATSKNIIEKKIVLIGGKDIQETPALYLKDKNRPLILAGNSKITGIAFLPKQGVKMGNIKGESYIHSRLIYGNKKESDSILPKLSAEVQNQINLLTDKNYIPSGKYLNKIPKQGLKNSFKSPVNIIRDNLVRIENVILAGNIIVSASKKIIVTKNSSLQDVILLAPKIEIKSGVKGCFQAIASESIDVGANCELQYPSILVVNRSKSRNNPTNNKITPDIFLQKNTQVKGMVLAIKTIKEQSYTPQIKIEENAFVTGEVYGTHNLELKGTVHGNVTVGGFIAMENGSIYQNHLYKGVINGEQLPYHYVGLLLRNRIDNKKIMKWLY